VKNKQTLFQETQQHITSHFLGKPPTNSSIPQIVEPPTMNPKSTLFKSTFSDSTKYGCAGQDQSCSTTKISSTDGTQLSSTEAWESHRRRARNDVDGSEGSGQLKNKLPDVAQIPRFRADFVGQRLDVIR
jgi:hypothetical protein